MLEGVDKSFRISGATCVKFLDCKDGACLVMVECIFFFFFFNFSLRVRCISELLKKLFLSEPDFIHYNLFSGLPW